MSQKHNLPNSVVAAQLASIRRPRKVVLPPLPPKRWPPDKLVHAWRNGLDEKLWSPNTLRATVVILGDNESFRAYILNDDTVTRIFDVLNKFYNQFVFDILRIWAESKSQGNFCFQSTVKQQTPLQLQGIFRNEPIAKFDTFPHDPPVGNRPPGLLEVQQVEHASESSQLTTEQTEESVALLSEKR